MKSSYSENDLLDSMESPSALLIPDSENRYCGENYSVSTSMKESTKSNYDPKGMESKHCLT